MSRNLDIMTAFQATYAAGDPVAACRRYVSETFELVEPPELPQGGVFHGWDAPLRVSAIYGAIWDVEILSAEFHEAADADIVFGHYRLKWTHKVTGKTMTQPILETNHIADGRIARMEVFHFDAGGLLKTMA